MQPHTLVHDEITPSVVKDGTIHLVGAIGNPHSLMMVCPCGKCGDVLSVNLKTTFDTFWRIRYHADQTISLFPNVKRHVGCNSRFSIAYNVVKVL